MEAHPGAK
jgi:hypothetical protein